jgi:sigma-B regulation protein RsbQ
MQAVLKRNNVSVLGKGTQPVLFAHGFGCDQNMWRFITPSFLDNYKVILFDYMGSGQSDVDGYDRGCK